MNSTDDTVLAGGDQDVVRGRHHRIDCVRMSRVLITEDKKKHQIKYCTILQN